MNELITVVSLESTDKLTKKEPKKEIFKLVDQNGKHYKVYGDFLKDKVGQEAWIKPVLKEANPPYPAYWVAWEPDTDEAGKPIESKASAPATAPAKDPSEKIAMPLPTSTATTPASEPNWEAIARRDTRKEFVAALISNHGLVPFTNEMHQMLTPYLDYVMSEAAPEGQDE